MMVAHLHRRLSWDEARLVFVVCIVQLVVAAALRVMPVRVLSSTIARHRAAARWILRAPEERIGWAIEAVGRRLPSISTCLVRALVADLFLGGAPRSGRVKIGVRRSNGLLESHAWFERDGRILVGGAGADEYVEFVTLQVEDSRATHHASGLC